MESLDKFSQARSQKKYINYFKRHQDSFQSQNVLLDELSTEFLESLLSFCIGIENVLYTSIVPFLVRELFSSLLLINESLDGIGEPNADDNQ